MLADQDVGEAKKVAVIHGNCQADALTSLLPSSPAFAREFEVSRIPAVHEVTSDDLPVLRDTLARADVIITQAVRDDYRGLPVGTDQILELAPGARVVRIPALYSDATFPYQVYLRDADGLPVDAPTTVYHDLRALALAAAGSSAGDVQALAEHRPPADALRHIAAIGDERLAELEAGSDIEITDVILDPHHRASSFWTVNHPTLQTLDVLAERIQAALGLTPTPCAIRDEILGAFRTPIDAPTIEALALDAEPSQTWTCEGIQHSVTSVLAEQLEFLKARPELIETGHEDHGQRLEALGLDGIGRKRFRGWLRRRRGSATAA